MLRDKFWVPTLPLDKDPNGPHVKSSYEEFTLGVWHVLMVKDKPFSILNFDWEGLCTTFGFLLHALHDVYTISPGLFAFSLIAHSWLAIEGPLSLYFSNKLFFFVSTRISFRCLC